MLTDLLDRWELLVELQQQRASWQYRWEKAAAAYSAALSELPASDAARLHKWFVENRPDMNALLTDLPQETQAKNAFDQVQLGAVDFASVFTGEPGHTENNAGSTEGTYSAADRYRSAPAGGPGVQSREVVAAYEASNASDSEAMDAGPSASELDSMLESVGIDIPAAETATELASEAPVEIKPVAEALTPAGQTSAHESASESRTIEQTEAKLPASTPPTASVPTKKPSPAPREPVEASAPTRQESPASSRGEASSAKAAAEEKTSNAAAEDVLKDVEHDPGPLLAWATEAIGGGLSENELFQALRRSPFAKQARELFEVLRELDAFEETKEGTIWVKAIADSQPKPKENSGNKAEKPVSGNATKATSGKR